MAKNVKCSQCKYLERFGVFSKTEGGYTSCRCKADYSIKLNTENINQLQDCPFYKSRTETAEQEIFRKYIIQGLPNLIKTIFKFFKK